MGAVVRKVRGREESEIEWKTPTGRGVRWESVNDVKDIIREHKVIGRQVYCTRERFPV